MRQNNKQSTPKRRSQRLIEAKASKKKRLPSPENAFRQTIWALPTEILLLIISNLSLPWKYSLALTCKSFTELTHRSTLPCLEGEGLIELLSTLQKNIPSVYFCYCCYKLRPFDPNLRWKSRPHEETLSKGDQAYGETPNIFPRIHWWPNGLQIDHVLFPEQFRHLVSNYNICFMEANLVMRRHFHGFSHGISLKNLEQYESCEDVIELQCIKLKDGCSYTFYDWEDTSNTKTQFSGDNFEALQIKKNTWRFFFRSIPKIIDNKLYVARFFTITGPLVSEELLEKVIGSMSISICPHLTCTAYPRCCYIKHKLPGRSRDCLSVQPREPYLQDDGEAVEFDLEQDSCPVCITDYRISLDQGISDEETNLNISTYHCLGSCQSPKDELWMSFGSRDPSLRRLLSSRAPELDRGSVQQEWHEAARVEDEMEVAGDMV
ncbi:hypothetical protein TRIATDRAFT_37302 [Trichoderma atroviride IMI 206040]|uniref:F-box domain-containing protein n=1 Tax=Hypocrea atroviridis (strain ATCC 20476 / IMI 206040) TaxID=452589 RepID=G9NZG4_HYPAI|nr:uncharacterized protein TRIATDRAFT_37302 [Trichoderma atroviride IMI 206040]EHK43870.1 hypothetical protein TRIATDRAFT_37302 [Trichoderma atroviride IMI 206040]